MDLFRSFTLIACLGLTLGGSASVIHAQFPSNLPVGTRVRVWLPESYRQGDDVWRRQLLRGSVESVSTDTIRVTIPHAIGSVAIPRASLLRLEVSQGVSRPASAVEQAFGSAIGGAFLWAVLNDPRGSRAPNYRTGWEAAGVGAAWGAGIGAITGFVFPHERWHRVRLSR